MNRIVILLLWLSCTALAQLPPVRQSTQGALSATLPTANEPGAIDLQKKIQEQLEKPIPTAPAQIPVAKQEETQEQQQKKAEPKTEVPEGFDTVDIEEGGNWLLKRKALEDTIDLIEQINKNFTQILEARMDFKIKHNQLENEFDLFVGSIGFDIGDLEKTLTFLVEQMEKERTAQGDLSEQEREVIKSLQDKKQDIEKLQATMKDLHDLENKVDDIMMTIEQQINVANGYQNQAWRNFQQIKKVLSDEKAEELYYNTEGLYKSLQDIYVYLKGTLTQYFNDQIQTLRTQMTAIKDAIKELHEKGVDLKNEVEKFEQRDLALEKQRAQAEEKEEVKKEVEQIKKEQQKGFFGRIWFGIKGIFNTFINGIVTVINKFLGLFGKK